MLALIAGPTASGKSALALALAQRTNGTIVNADSAQVYRDLRILSARPSEDEETEVPHKLYGYRDGASACSAAAWANDAKAAVAEAHQAGRLPILAGGTGLYLRTLLEGIAPVPEIAPVIRTEVRALPVEQAFAALEEEDPAAAARLRPSDTTRIARALEVVRSTRHPLAYWQREKIGGIAAEVRLLPLVLLPPREWLYDKCNLRFERMFGAEGIGEVEALIGRGLDPSLPVMRAIGVPEIAAYLQGSSSREAALAAGQAATRQYAKRQYTWFSRQPPSGWPRFAEPLDERTIDRALAFLS